MGHHHDIDADPPWAFVILRGTLVGAGLGLLAGAAVMLVAMDSLWGLGGVLFGAASGAVVGLFAGFVSSMTGAIGHAWGTRWSPRGRPMGFIRRCRPRGRRSVLDDAAG